MDLQLPSGVVGGRNLTYYLAISVIIFLAWTWRNRRPTSGVDAPFYKASKMKWMFDAESLIIDSYNKVQHLEFPERCLGILHRRRRETVG